MNAGAEQSNGAGYGSEPYSPIFAVENRAVRDFICLFSKPHTVYKRIDPAGSQTRGTKAVAAGIRLCTCDPCRWRRPYFRKSAVFSNLLRKRLYSRVHMEIFGKFNRPQNSVQRTNADICGPSKVLPSTQRSFKLFHSSYLYRRILPLLLEVRGRFRYARASLSASAAFRFCNDIPYRSDEEDTDAEKKPAVCHDAFQNGKYIQEGAATDATLRHEIHRRYQHAIVSDQQNTRNISLSDRRFCTPRKDSPLQRDL